MLNLDVGTPPRPRISYEARAYLWTKAMLLADRVHAAKPVSRFAAKKADAALKLLEAHERHTSLARMVRRFHEQAKARRP